MSRAYSSRTDSAHIIGGPFIVGEFTPHDSGLLSESLNNDPAACLNSERIFYKEGQVLSR